jgi:hypothetical protein
MSEPKAKHSPVEGSRHYVDDGRPRGLEPVVVAIADDLKAARDELDLLRAVAMEASKARDVADAGVTDAVLIIHENRLRVALGNAGYKTTESTPSPIEAENDAMAALLERVYVETTFVGGCQPSVESSERMRAILADRSKRMGEKAAGR